MKSFRSQNAVLVLVVFAESNDKTLEAAQVLADDIVTEQEERECDSAYTRITTNTRIFGEKAGLEKTLLIVSCLAA